MEQIRILGESSAGGIVEGIDRGRDHVGLVLAIGCLAAAAALLTRKRPTSIDVGSKDEVPSDTGAPSRANPPVREESRQYLMITLSTLGLIVVLILLVLTANGLLDGIFGALHISPNYSDTEGASYSGNRLLRYIQLQFGDNDGQTAVLGALASAALAAAWVVRRRKRNTVATRVLVSWILAIWATVIFLVASMDEQLVIVSPNGSGLSFTVQEGVFVALVVAGALLFATDYRSAASRSNLGAALFSGVVVGLVITVTTATPDPSELARAQRGLDLMDRLDLSYVDLSDLDWSDAYLPRRDFTGANLSSTNLIGSNLGHSIFRDARLEQTYLGGAKLIHADFTRSHLTSAVLDKSDLQYTKFDGATLDDTSFYGADLRHADFSRVGDRPDPRQFAGAMFDQSTKWPGSFNAALIPNNKPPLASSSGCCGQPYAEFLIE